MKKLFCLLALVPILVFAQKSSSGKSGGFSSGMTRSSSSSSSYKPSSSSSSWNSSSSSSSTKTYPSSSSSSNYKYYKPSTPASSSSSNYKYYKSSTPTTTYKTTKYGSSTPSSSTSSQTTKTVVRNTTVHVHNTTVYTPARRWQINVVPNVHYVSTAYVGSRQVYVYPGGGYSYMDGGAIMGYVDDTSYLNQYVNNAPVETIIVQRPPVQQPQVVYVDNTPPTPINWSLMLFICPGLPILGFVAFKFFSGKPRVL